MMMSRLGRRSLSLRKFATLVSKKVNGNTCHATIERSLDNKKAILCIPGALGTGATDFSYQLKAFQDYSVVAFHPDFKHTTSKDLLRLNAHDAAAFMKELGFDKYSVLAWSDGANTAAILAAEYPKQMERLVLMGGNSYLTDEDLGFYNSIADVMTWNPRHRDSCAEAHGGMDKLQDLWTKWLITMQQIIEEGGDLCTSYLPDIKCKTLVLHGEIDPLVPTDHAHYISERILHSKLMFIPNGKHNIHMSQADIVNNIIRDFLVEADDKETHSREFAAMPPKDPKEPKEKIPVYHSGPRC
ncbi:hypothetical protein THRCLA_20961 [Thraustotheca clavata]|uniref:AB hydrolase-1 domain-containing protein n=1 Tax=Thraustotheca clavata TaxID=74557 RepID=A0A1W0A286_9STRA|nr:hypothetical protein THRCLA_20961 [Thraustotheca clavata]